MQGDTKTTTLDQQEPCSKDGKEGTLGRYTNSDPPGDTGHRGLTAEEPRGDDVATVRELAPPGRPISS